MTGVFKPANLVWQNLLHAQELGYMTIGDHGFFSYTRGTAGITLTNNGRTATGDANGDRQAFSAQTIFGSGDTNTAYALEIVLNSGSGGLTFGDSNGDYQDLPGTFAVGDVVGLVFEKTRVTAYVNGLQNAVASIPFSGAVTFEIYGFHVTAFQFTAETVIDVMQYGSVYRTATPAVVDWPFDAGEPLATALVVSPGSRSTINGTAAPYTVSVAHRLAAPVTVGITSSDSTDVVSPSSVTLTDSSRSAAFSVNASVAGTKTISTTNGAGLTNASATLTSASTGGGGGGGEQPLTPSGTNQTQDLFGATVGTPVGFYVDITQASTSTSSLSFTFLDYAHYAGGTAAEYDFYIKFNAVPTTTSYDYTGHVSDANPVVPAAAPGPTLDGRWHILIVATTTFPSPSGAIATQFNA